MRATHRWAGMTRRALSVMALVIGLIVAAGVVPVGAASPAVSPAWKTIPGTVRTKDRPAATTHAGRTWVFIRATDDQLWYTRRTSSGWTAWTRLPSAFAIKNAPAVVSFDGRLNVFVRRATDDHLMRRTWDGSRWSRWSDVTATDGTTASGPAATVFGSLYLFIRRPDNTIWFNTLAGSTWAGWAEVPGLGRTDMAPTAVSTPSGPRVVVNGESDDFLYYNLSSDGTFYGWVVQSGVTTPATPAVASLDSSMFEVSRASDNAVKARFFDGLAWGPVFDVPGGATTRSGPGATGTAKGALVFIRNANNKVSWTLLTAAAAP